jgi:hypothetical protein
MNIDPVEPPFRSAPPATFPAPPRAPLATLVELDPDAFDALRTGSGRASRPEDELDATLRALAEGRADQLEPGRRRQLGLVDS